MRVVLSCVHRRQRVRAVQDGDSVIKPIDIAEVTRRVDAAVERDPIIKNHGLRVAEDRLVEITTAILVDEFNRKLEEIQRACLQPPEEDYQFQKRIRCSGVSLGACVQVISLHGDELDAYAKTLGFERLGWRR